METRFAEELGGDLSGRALEALPEASLFADLAQSTADALAVSADLPDHVLAAAEVRDGDPAVCRN
ncbi:MAG TPA: hypothetical protein VFV41_21795 [Streptosporangiaceae bacterium]|nr:hypothetical protein [Streptosporangiaceae bacterium]